MGEAENSPAGPELGAVAAGRRPTWLEGFYDLVFAFAVTELAARLGRDPSPGAAAGFVFLFLSVWWAWVGTTVYFDRFDRGQPWLRLVIGAQLLAVAALAIHVGDALESGSRDFALAYAVIRLVLVGLYWQTRQERGEAGRALATRYATGFGVAATAWALSALIPAPARFGAWGLALIVDYATPLTARQLQQRVRLDASHLPERFGLFTLIVLGESIAASAGSLAGRRWDAASALAGALGVAAAFGVWWSYFDHLENAPVHRTRLAGQVWFYGHLPLLMAMTALADGIRLLVAASGEPLPPAPDRLLAGIGAAVTVASLSLVRLTTVDAGTRDVIARVLLGAGLGVLAAAVATAAPWPALATVALLATACALPGAVEGAASLWPATAKQEGERPAT